LHPKSTRTYANIGDVFVKMGRSQAEVDFYAGAIKGLPEDPTLDDNQRKRLAATWQSALDALRAKPSPTTKP
jgi:hypothetical protein